MTTHNNNTSKRYKEHFGCFHHKLWGGIYFSPNLHIYKLYPVIQLHRYGCVMCIFDFLKTRSFYIPKTNNKLMILPPQYLKSWDDGSPLHEVYIHNCKKKSWKFQLICKHLGSNLHGINATGVGERVAKEKQQGKEMDRAILRTNKGSFPPEAIERQKTQKLADKVENKSVVNFKPIRLKLSSPPELWKTVRKENYEERIMMKPFLQPGTAL